MSLYNILHEAWNKRLKSTTENLSTQIWEMNMKWWLAWQPTGPHAGSMYTVVKLPKLKLNLWFYIIKSSSAVVVQWTKKRDWFANNPKASVWLFFFQKPDRIIHVQAGNSIISLIRQAATFLACLTQGQFYGAISGNETEGSDWPISCLRKHGPASKPRGKKKNNQNPKTHRKKRGIWRSGGKLRHNWSDVNRKCLNTRLFSLVHQ